jgi:hypothetical protein
MEELKYSEGAGARLRECWRMQRNSVPQKQIWYWTNKTKVTFNAYYKAAQVKSSTVTKQLQPMNTLMSSSKYGVPSMCPSPSWAPGQESVTLNSC